MYWRLALSLTTREQRELGMKLRSAVISSEWVQYPHVLASGVYNRASNEGSLVHQLCCAAGKITIFLLATRIDTDRII